MSQVRDMLNSSGKKAPKPKLQEQAQSGPMGEAETHSSEKILIVQSAHPERVLRALERLKEGHVFAHPSYTLLCRNRPEILEFFRDHPMLGGIRGHSGVRTAWRNLRSLRAEKYDGIVLIFAGESGHWKIKLLAFLLGVHNKLIFKEDNDYFLFTWKAASSLVRQRLASRLEVFCRHRMLRMRTWLKWPFHRRPRPAAPEGEQERYPGERILILQSAHPPGVLRALDRLGQAPLFHHPRYTLFCRDFPEVRAQFQSHPMLYETRVHTRAQNSWEHLRRLRHEQFDAVVLFMAGDQGYWKIQCFAFLLGARHKVIFNENNDCFYFTWNAWLRLLAHRMGTRSKLSAHPGWSSQFAGLLLFLVKLLLLPFRFAWLLMVWLHLRRSTMKASS
jgi:ADP-heptose:LPS heptosyltransferase